MRCLAALIMLVNLPLWCAGQEIVLKGHADDIFFGLVFSPDGKTLASRSFSVKLWNVETGKERLTVVDDSQATLWYGVAFSPDSKLIAIGDADNHVVRLFDAATGKEQCAPIPQRGFVDDLAFSPDGKLLVSIGYAVTNNKVFGQVRLWNVKTGKERFFLEQDGSLGPLAVSPDGRVLAVGCGEEDIALFEVSSGKVRATLKGHVWPVVHLSFTNVGKTLVSGSSEGVVKFWDIATGKETKTSTDPDQTGLTGVAVSPNGKLLALSYAQKKAIVLVDVPSGKELLSMKVEGRITTQAVFSPDGQKLAVAVESTIRLWNVATLLKQKPTSKKLTPSK